jgi:ABC-type sugar transport system ATPase subunit
MTQMPAATAAARHREVLLSARGLSKSYGGLRAVDNASLDLHSGEVVALVGDNGAGKSTFVKMLSGVIMPDAGTLALHGGEVHFASPTQAREAGIETLHQSLALVDVFDVPENIFLGRELSNRRFGVLPMLRPEGLDLALLGVVELGDVVPGDERRGKDDLLRHARAPQNLDGSVHRLRAEGKVLPGGAKLPVVAPTA